MSRATRTLGPTSLEMIARTTRGRTGIQLTVGLLSHDDTATVRVFDSLGERDPWGHLYEIGSITKTLTASLLAKHVDEGQMSLSDPLAQHLEWLDQSTYSPPLERVAAHVAGYSATAPLTRLQYARIILDLIRGRNQNVNPMAVSEDRFRDLAGESKVEDRDYAWKYSNLGYALLGCAVSSAAGEDYTAAMTTYLRDDLSLLNTHVGTSPTRNLNGTTRKGDDCGNWDWSTADQQLMRPAGAISSTADDLLKYARIYINEQHGYLSMLLSHRANISRHDDMALGWWLMKNDHRVIHHGGGTGSFGSFLVIDLRRGAAAVVLTNQRLGRDAERRLGQSVLQDARG